MGAAQLRILTYNIMINGTSVEQCGEGASGAAPSPGAFRPGVSIKRYWFEPLQAGGIKKLKVLKLHTLLKKYLDCSFKSFLAFADGDRGRGGWVGWFLRRSVSKRNPESYAPIFDKFGDG